ncbi:MAG: helix-hairpin-helix domain-containing protein [Ekhidna sp.]|uniref:ComEA family DNA-binding protein n=1 Tax=Ekhidna sp. TaxID=2608089 RepID=UPI0032EA9877
MFKFITNAISRALGFTRTESRGTLVLIFIIFIAILLSHYRISILKSKSTIGPDSTALAWINEVQASYDVKEDGEDFDKSVFFPVKKDFAKKETQPKPWKKETEPVEKIIIADLNMASVEDLQKVRGIGPAYSERIVKYRDLLGGFSDTSQLKEVYGLKKETIDELVKHFQVQSSVTPLDINSDSIKVLAKHPYINYDLARVIINYRKVHGDITSAEDLKKIKAIDERTFLRIKPYLK